MSHICKYCGKEFETGRELGSHYLKCLQNPNHDEIIAKAAISNRERNGKHLITVNCVVCGKEYEVFVSDRDYLLGKYRKCCSKLCSNRLTKMNSNQNEVNQKRSDSLKLYYKNKLKSYTCQHCGKEYIRTSDNHSFKYCSDECMRAERHEKLSKLAVVNQAGGLKPETTHSYYKRGYYYNIWCDSSWELAFVIYCLDHNMNIKRNKTYLEYSYDGKIYKFYPDFIVDETLVEIKGFYTPKNRAKREQHPEIEFIDKDKIQPYLEYVIKEYGRNFTDLYDK